MRRQPGRMATFAQTIEMISKCEQDRSNDRVEPGSSKFGAAA